MITSKADKKRIREEFAQIYSDHFSQVFSAVYTKIGDLDDSDDITQEVFIIFYNKFEEIEKPRQWLLGTLRNLIKRYFEKKHKNESVEDFLQDVSLTYVNGFRDARIIITDAIESIECTEEERALLDLIAYHNYSYNHAAIIMGLSKRKVGYKYNQSVKKILNFLKSKGIENIEDLL